MKEIQPFVVLAEEGVDENHSDIGGMIRWWWGGGAQVTEGVYNRADNFRQFFSWCRDGIRLPLELRRASRGPGLTVSPSPVGVDSRKFSMSTLLAFLGEKLRATDSLRLTE